MPIAPCRSPGFAGRMIRRANRANAWNSAAALELWASDPSRRCRASMLPIDSQAGSQAIVDARLPPAKPRNLRQPGHGSQSRDFVNDRRPGRPALGDAARTIDLACFVFRPEALDPFVHRFGAHPQGRGHGLRGLPFDQHPTHQFGSTMRRQTGILTAKGCTSMTPMSTSPRSHGRPRHSRPRTTLGGVPISGQAGPTFL